jgi:predicted RNase H-like HicB family nuclease
MRNELTAIVERDERWYIAYSPEIPGANGQGRTKAAAVRSLAGAIALILEDRRKDGLRGGPRGRLDMPSNNRMNLTAVPRAARYPERWADERPFRMVS